jgi:SAM-dependent methyltransferase
MRPCDGYDKAAHLYDIFDTKPNIGFFLHYASRASEVIDIGAGTGRIAIPAARKGISVVCVEPSAAMRRVFQQKLDRMPQVSERIVIVDADAASFSLGRCLPAALMSGSFDHLLDDDERIEVLANIARHLAPGGTLVFDVFIGLMTDSPPTPAGEICRDGVTCRRLISKRVLPNRTIELELVYEIKPRTGPAKRIVQRSMAGITDRSRVHDLLARTGFRIAGEFGDYAFTPFAEDSDILIIEASRTNRP